MEQKNEMLGNHFRSISFLSPANFLFSFSLLDGVIFHTQGNFFFFLSWEKYLEGLIILISSLLPAFLLRPKKTKVRILLPHALISLIYFPSSFLLSKLPFPASFLPFPFFPSSFLNFTHAKIKLDSKKLSIYITLFLFFFSSRNWESGKVERKDARPGVSPVQILYASQCQKGRRRGNQGLFLFYSQAFHTFCLWLHSSISKK